jgi:hypothetical protein
VLAGCGLQRVDPCDGVGGTCLAIQVESSAAVSQVDTLSVHVAGSGLDATRPVPIKGRASLPLAIGVVLDSLPQSPLGVDLTVLGSLGGAASEGHATAQLTSGRHTTVHLTLGVAETQDLAASEDGGAGDLSTPTDGGEADGPGFDLTTPDLPPIPPDPVTCAEADQMKSHLGCDFWPTQSYNSVWSVFDFAVVVSNPGAATAHLTISGGALGSTKVVLAPPGQLVAIGLPWVSALKGSDADSNGSSSPPQHSILAAKGAYHLTSDVPIVAYQFNALEYKGGASGNDLNNIAWSTCPGSTTAAGCYAFTNDAALLLPTSALTGSYYVTGIHGDDSWLPPSTEMPIDGPFVVITATADATTVKIRLGAKAHVIGASDGGVNDGPAFSTMMFTLQAGDVVELLAAANGTQSDLTGSQIYADHPVQVLSGHPCATNPQVNPVGGSPSYSCDHVEEVQLPYETWGKSYVVTAPTGPKGDVPGHTVRIYGGVSAATLTYSPAVTGAPSTIAAGAVAELDTTTSFFVSGDHEFAVGTLQKSGSIVDPTGGSTQKGDPSLSFFAPVEQYRGRYLFLAPNDYDVSYADVALPLGTHLVLDNVAVAQAPTVIGGGYGVVRLLIGGGVTGAHLLTGDRPFGVQLVGYGAYTSYQYPAGVALTRISTPPPPL